MPPETGAKASNILPVQRTREEARRYYDRISRFYDCISGPFERKHSNRALALLSIKEGETVLEVGVGTGYCLKQIAQSAGKAGKVCGIDLSSGMLEATRKRLTKAKLLDRVELHCGDSMSLPFADGTFDAIFMSYTLELFDTPDIPKLLEEVKRVLKPGGRLGIVSMSREGKQTFLLRLYEWAHQKWPRYLDCRPIYVEQTLREAGYEVANNEKVSLVGLPCEVVIAVKRDE